MRKRGKGEGSVSQRKDGCWEARLTLSDGRRKSFYGKTRQEVTRRLAAAQADQAKGLPVAAEKQTVEQYLSSWLEVMKNQLDSSSFRRYQNQVRLHLVPALGSIKLAHLTAQQIQLFYTRKVESLSPNTVRHIHAVFHHALKEAVRLSLLPRNPADLVRIPRAARRETQTLTEQQMTTLLASLTEDRFFALYALALTTGMREGELLGLRWQDIDWRQRLLHVTQAVQEGQNIATGKKRYQLAEPKTRRHPVALSEYAITALLAHQQRQVEERALVGAAWHQEDLVFPNAVGQMMLPSTLYRQFQRRLKNAGIAPIRFHDLRHTIATLLLSRGVNVKLVSEMLGHVLPHMHEAAATVVDSILGPEKENRRQIRGPQPAEEDGERSD